MKQTSGECLYCKQPIDSFKGRKDRKYCDDRCRSSFHNQQREELNAVTGRVNNILLHNMKLLKTLLADKTTVSVSKEVLMRKGFSFDYHTQVYKDYRFCYEYGYIAKGEKYCKIVKGFKDIVEKV